MLSWLTVIWWMTVSHPHLCRVWEEHPQNKYAAEPAELGSVCPSSVHMRGFKTHALFRKLDLILNAWISVSQTRKLIHTNKAVTFYCLRALTVPACVAERPSSWLNPQTVRDWLTAAVRRNGFVMERGGKKKQTNPRRYCTVLSRDGLSYLHIPRRWYYDHTLHGSLFEMFLREAWSMNILWALKINCLQWSKPTVPRWFPLKY